MVLSIKISSRWFGVPGDAPPAAAARQKLRQWHSSSPKDQHHGTLGTWGAVHAVLLHALSTDGMGESQRGAIQSHFTDWEVSPKSFFCFEMYKDNYSLVPVRARGFWRSGIRRFLDLDLHSQSLPSIG